MKFEHIVPAYIEGATLLGLSLDSLHSDVIDREGLKQWTSALAQLIPDSIGTTLYGEDTPFYDAFERDLGYFCIYVASADGYVSDDEIDSINWLLDYRAPITRRVIDSMLKMVTQPEWRESYPISFWWIVAELGHSEDIMTVAQAAYYYRAIAEFIYSIDNNGSFKTDSPANDYVEAFFKYIERTSPLRFLPPENEFTISEVLDSWSKLVADEYENMKNGICGSWKAISGNALFSGGLSDLVLEKDGRGYMTRKKLFGTKRIDVSWEISELPGMNAQAPVLYVPDIKASVVMLMMESGLMAATVYSNDPRLNLKMATYQRL